MCVTDWVIVHIDFTDVTLVSDDTYGDGNWNEEDDEGDEGNEGDEGDEGDEDEEYEEYVENQTEKTAQIDVSLAFLHFLPLLRLLRTWVYAHDVWCNRWKRLVEFISLTQFTQLTQIRHIKFLPLLPRSFSLPGSTCRHFWGREDVSLNSTPGQRREQG